MHTALVSRILRDRSLWEQTTDDQSSEPADHPIPTSIEGRLI